MCKLDGEALGHWQKQLRNGHVDEADLRKMIGDANVDDILSRLKKKTSGTHDANNIIESTRKTEDAARRAAQDLADGKITQDMFHEIMDTLT
jgi:hypothetical protein